MGDNAFSFDLDTWRENLPLQSVDYTKDPTVRAAVFVFYRDGGPESPTDSIDILVGAEEEVSAFTIMGVLEDAKLTIQSRCLRPGEEER